MEYIINHNAKIPPVRYHEFNPQDKTTRLLPTMGFSGTVENKTPFYPVSGLLLEFTNLPSTNAYRLIFCSIGNELILLLYKYNDMNTYKKGAYLGDSFYDDGFFQYVMRVNLSKRIGQIEYLGTLLPFMRFALTNPNKRKVFITYFPVIKNLIKDSWHFDDDVSALRHCLKAFSKPDVVSYYTEQFSEKKFDYMLFTYGKNYGVPSDKTIEKPTS